MTHFSFLPSPCGTQIDSDVQRFVSVTNEYLAVAADVHRLHIITAIYNIRKGPKYHHLGRKGSAD